MSDDKIKIYQPKIAPVYPHPLTGDLVTICINREWLPLLQGFLHPLRWKSAIWEGTTEEVDLMHKYIEDLLSVLGDDENCAMDCDKISDLRIYQGKLQKKLCGSSTWQTVGRVNPIVNYRNNLLLLDVDGDDIVDVSFGPNPTDIPSEPEEPRNYDHICAGVNGLLDWMTSLYLSSLTETERMINGVASAADVVFAIYTSGGGEITPVDNIIDFIQSMSLALLNAQRDQLSDPVYQEEIRCNLYCLLKGSDGSLTETVFNDWLDTIPDYPNVPGGAGWNNNIQDMFLFEAIQKRYRIYSLNNDATCEELCTDCITYDWEQVFDFTAESYSVFFSPFNGNLSAWEDGSGWVSVYNLLDPDQRRLMNYLRMESPLEATFTELHMTYLLGDISSNENFTSAGATIRTDDTLDDLPEGVTGSTNSEGEHVLSWQGEYTGDVFVFSYYGGFKYHPTEPAGFIDFRSLVVRGLGVNPFA